MLFFAFCLHFFYKHYKFFIIFYIAENITKNCDKSSNDIFPSPLKSAAIAVFPDNINSGLSLICAINLEKSTKLIFPSPFKSAGRPALVCYRQWCRLHCCALPQSICWDLFQRFGLRPPSHPLAVPGDLAFSVPNPSH